MKWVNKWHLLHREELGVRIRDRIKVALLLALILGAFVTLIALVLFDQALHPH